ncbi:MAG: lysylphosphatidylglycerol synthase transmembrane domain-containing protein [Erysipelotrichaceae bacterium]|nr:lysylphosphatidylglycerol synthase transmembrane domain-containing protein [Erysipelotrichaceae bacterium]MDD3808658.1 lysylphosphatidylglycerol synthase transmembrane domain-containing protein [Erysipelotrichaceae bacterium]
MNNRKTIFRNLLLVLLVSGGSIYLLFKDNLGDSLRALKNANLFFVLISFFVMFCYFLVDAMILTKFSKLYNKNYKYSQGLRNSLSAAFFNGVTPFSSGGQFAQVYVFNKQKIKPCESSSILLMGFIVYQTVLVAFSIVVIAFRFKAYRALYSDVFLLTLVGFLVNFFVIVGLYLGASSSKFQKFISNVVIRLLAKVKIVKNFHDTKIRFEVQLNNFRTEVKHLKKNKRLLIVASIGNVLKLVFIYSIPFFAGLALNVPLGFSQLFEFIGISSFIYMVTAFVPVPGASGGSEGIYFILFSPLLGGVLTPTTMLLWRIITYYLGLIFGGLVFAIDREING